MQRKNPSFNLLRLSKNQSSLSIFGLLFFILAFTYQSCERDDICADVTETTPRLLIEFYDVTDIDVLKSVTRLSVYAEDLVTDNGVITFPEAASNATLIFNSNSNTLELPLQVTEEGTPTTLRYYFESDTNLRLDGDPLTESNIDILEITYTTEFVYVSRACGFKSNFNDLNAFQNPGSDGIDWIQNISYFEAIAPITVENENTAHVQIFH